MKYSLVKLFSRRVPSALTDEATIKEQQETWNEVQKLGASRLVDGSHDDLYRKFVNLNVRIFTPASALIACLGVLREVQDSLSGSSKEGQKKISSIKVQVQRLLAYYIKDHDTFHKTLGSEDALKLMRCCIAFVKDKVRHAGQREKSTAREALMVFIKAFGKEELPNIEATLQARDLAQFVKKLTVDCQDIVPEKTKSQALSELNKILEKTLAPNSDKFLPRNRVTVEAIRDDLIDATRKLSDELRAEEKHNATFANNINLTYGQKDLLAVTTMKTELQRRLVDLREQAVQLIKTLKEDPHKHLALASTSTYQPSQPPQPLGRRVAEEDVQVAEYHGIKVFRQDLESLNVGNWLTDPVIAVELKRLGEKYPHAHIEPPDTALSWGFVDLDEQVREAEERDKRDEAENTPSGAKAIKDTIDERHKKLKDKEVVVMTVNIEGNHWVTLICNRRQTPPHFYSFDSLGKETTATGLISLLESKETTARRERTNTRLKEMIPNIANHIDGTKLTAKQVDKIFHERAMPPQPNFDECGPYMLAGIDHLLEVDKNTTDFDFRDIKVPKKEFKQKAGDVRSNLQRFFEGDKLQGTKGLMDGFELPANERKESVTQRQATVLAITDTLAIENLTIDHVEIPKNPPPIFDGVVQRIADGFAYSVPSNFEPFYDEKNNHKLRFKYKATETSEEKILDKLLIYRTPLADKMRSENADLTGVIAVGQKIRVEPTEIRGTAKVTALTPPLSVSRPPSVESLKQGPTWYEIAPEMAVDTSRDFSIVGGETIGAEITLPAKPQLIPLDKRTILKDCSAVCRTSRDSVVLRANHGNLHEVSLAFLALEGISGDEFNDAVQQKKTITVTFNPLTAERAAAWLAERNANAYLSNKSEIVSMEQMNVSGPLSDEDLAAIACKLGRPDVTQEDVQEAAYDTATDIAGKIPHITGIGTVVYLQGDDPTKGPLIQVPLARQQIFTNKNDVNDLLARLKNNGQVRFQLPPVDENHVTGLAQQGVVIPKPMSAVQRANSQRSNKSGIG